MSSYKVVFCITINEEGPEKLEPNFEGIIININKLNQKFGFIADDILVVIIADGLSTLSPEYKQIFFKNRELKHDPNILHQQLDIPNHYIHLFISEYQNGYENIPLEFSRIQLLFAVKEGHFGRKNSIMHFLNGIQYEIASKCGSIPPEEIITEQFVMIQKPEVKLHKHAIYKFLLTFRYHPEAVSVSGQIEIIPDFVKIVSIEAGQMLEYKLENIYERHYENNFHFIMNTSPSIYLYRYRPIVELGFQNTSFF